MIRVIEDSGYCKLINIFKTWADAEEFCKMARSWSDYEEIGYYTWCAKDGTKIYIESES